jgi:hypothetical protein
VTFDLERTVALLRRGRSEGSATWGLQTSSGEIAVLASGARTASVATTKPLRAIAWSKREVWAVAQTAPEAARRLRSALDEHRA